MCWLDHGTVRPRKARKSRVKSAGSNECSRLPGWVGRSPVISIGSLQHILDYYHGWPKSYNIWDAVRYEKVSKVRIYVYIITMNGRVNQLMFIKSIYVHTITTKMESFISYNNLVHGLRWLWNSNPKDWLPPKKMIDHNRIPWKKTPLKQLQIVLPSSLNHRKSTSHIPSHRLNESRTEWIQDTKTRLGGHFWSTSCVIRSLGNGNLRPLYLPCPKEPFPTAPSGGSRQKSRINKP